MWSKFAIVTKVGFITVSAVILLMIQLFSNGGLISYMYTVDQNSAFVTLGILLFAYMLIVGVIGGYKFGKLYGFFEFITLPVMLTSGALTFYCLFIKEGFGLSFGIAFALQASLAAGAMLLGNVFGTIIAGKPYRKDDFFLFRFPLALLLLGLGGYYDWKMSEAGFKFLSTAQEYMQEKYFYERQIDLSQDVDERNHYKQALDLKKNAAVSVIADYGNPNDNYFIWIMDVTDEMYAENMHNHGEFKAVLSRYGSSILTLLVIAGNFVLMYISTKDENEY